jgi:hypothetical protein
MPRLRPLASSPRPGDLSEPSLGAPNRRAAGPLFLQPGTSPSGEAMEE